MTHSTFGITSETRSISLDAVKWTYFQTLALRLVPPLTTVALARFLSPSEFGLVAVATTTLSFLQIFRDLGLAKALIQTDEAETAVFNVVFWINLSLSLILYAFLFITAPSFSYFFNSPHSIPVLRILGLTLIFDSLGSVQKNALIRDLQFKSLFYRTSPPTFIPLAITLPLAYFGFGVWSLVIGNLASVFISSLLLWTAIPWRPSFHFHRDTARRVMVFGLWVTVEAFVGWFYVQGDNAIVGRYFSAHEFGIYVVSYSMIAMLIASLLSPVSAIAYPAFSRIQKDRKLLSSKLLDTLRLCSLVSLPTGVGVFLVSDILTATVFGGKWLGMETVLGPLAIAQGLAWIVAANPDAFRAIGRPDIIGKFQLAKLMYTLPAYLIAAQLGLMTFVYCKLAVTLVGTLLWFLLTAGTFPIRFFDLAKSLKVSVLSTACMAMCVILVRHLLAIFCTPVAIVNLIIPIMTGIISYAACLYLFDTSLLRRLLDIGFRSMGIRCKLIV